jgi:hypothetical protein
MGRAHAPQRRSHHHRPVISFKDLSTREEILMRSNEGDCSGCFLRLITYYSSLDSDPQPGYRGFVIFRVWIREQARFELLQLPNLEIRQIT